MRYLWTLLLVFALTGCDKVVSRTVAGPTTVQAGQADCDAGAGYCYGCGMTFGGKYECSFAFRYSCGGKQDALYRVTPIQIKYESGRVEMDRHFELIKTTGQCH